MKKWVLILLGIYVFGSLCITGYYRYQEVSYIYSGDGRVKVDMTILGSPVVGMVKELVVKENDRLSKGEVLGYMESSPGQNRQTERISIVAPTNGQILRISTHKGEAVAAGQALMAIANLDKAYVEIRVPEDKSGRIKPGQKAEVQIDTQPNQTFEGIVQEVGSYTEVALWPVVSITAGRQQPKEKELVPIKVLVPDISLIPGTNASAKIHVKEGA